MLPKNTPYPYDGMPDEDYFGEFRELSNSIGEYEDVDNEKITKENNHRDPDYKKSEEVFNEFSIFPMD